MTEFILEVKEEMTSEEMISLAKDSGAESVYIMGGMEPLDRSNLDGEIKEIRKNAEVRIETNGQILAQTADKLKELGVKQVIVRTDTLKHSRFQKEDDEWSMDNIFRGINRITDINLKPVRIKTVIEKEVNEDEILDYLQLTFQHDYEILYIPGEGMTKADILKKLPAYVKSPDDEYDVEWGKYPGAIGKVCFEK